MKNVLHYGMAYVVIAMLATSCGSKAPQSSANRTEVELPFASHTTDQEAFRGVGTGTSPDRGFAMEQAKLDARTSIAQEVETSVKSAIERYREQFGSTDDTVESSYGAKAEALTLNLVDQTLSNMIVEDQKVYELNGGDELMYEANVAVTLKRDDFMNALEGAIDNNNTMADDTKVRIEYDRQKFRKVFQQEIEELRQEESANK